MAFGFPAQYTGRYTPRNNDPAVLHEAVREAFRSLAWPYANETNGRIVAFIGYSVISWGEEVVVGVQPDNSLLITSKCILPVQFFDYGKNKANVLTFIAQIRKFV